MRAVEALLFRVICCLKNCKGIFTGLCKEMVYQFKDINLKFVRSLQPGISIMFRSLLWFK